MYIIKHKQWSCKHFKEHNHKQRKLDLWQESIEFCLQGIVLQNKMFSCAYKNQNQKVIDIKELYLKI